MKNTPLSQKALIALCTKNAELDCTCPLVSHSGWQSISEHRWRKDQLILKGSLRDLSLAEPTFEEWHPEGTRNESAQAPVAPLFFPYNRCEVYACQTCLQVVLRYTEAGGYYVDQRARRINAALITGQNTPL
jgi:hypothetical protein